MENEEQMKLWRPVLAYSKLLSQIALYETVMKSSSATRKIEILSQASLLYLDLRRVVGMIYFHVVSTSSVLSSRFGQGSLCLLWTLEPTGESW